MRSVEQKRLTTIGQSARRDLHSAFGITFANPPKMDLLTRGVINNHASEELAKLEFAPWQMVLLRVKHRMSGGLGYQGLFREEDNTCYIKPLRGMQKNVVGKKEIPRESAEKHVALHESTHAYLAERGFQWKGEFFWQEFAGIKEGRMPNIEGLLVASIWEEGLCEFAAVAAEVHAQPTRTLSGLNSESGTRGYIYNHIEALQPEDEDYYRTDWLFEGQKILEAESLRIQQEFNFTQAQQLPIYESVVILTPQIKMQTTYAIGYNFAERAYVALLGEGYSSEEAFELIAANHPKTCYDLTHPESFVDFLL